MFKYGLALVVGASAAYYWWTRHNGLDDDLRHLGDRIRHTHWNPNRNDDMLGEGEEL